MVEKKYLLVNIEDVKPGVSITSDGAEIVYVVDNPFKQYLFDEAIKEGKTEITDREEFDWDIEIYKLLKQSTYLGYNNITISILSGWSGQFTLDEAKMICDMYEKTVMDIDELLNEIKNRIETMKRGPKIVVYTCITGGYDNILEPTYVTPGVDYICFTDDNTLKSKTWKFRPIPEELLTYSKVKQQRAIKILAHRYLSDYDLSIWVDGAVIVKGNITDYLKTLDTVKYSVFVPEHPARKCIYAEKDACVKIKKIKGGEITIADKQMKRYKDEGFPANYGLVQTNIMVRLHNDQYSKELMEKWWSELKDYSHRDQLSFNYALWKCTPKKFKYLIKTTCNSKFFNWIKSHKKK
jgi:hypothetical protein